MGRSQRRRDRRGSTLIEQLTLLTVLGILATIGMHGAKRLLDSASVHTATREVADLLALAREQAASSGARTAVRFDVARARVVVHTGSDTIARYALDRHTGVALEASRDSMAYAPSGLGFGAANLRIVLRKGVSAETVTVSRLGRVRRQ